MADVTLPVVLSTWKKAWQGLPGGVGQTGVVPAAVAGCERNIQAAVSSMRPKASAIDFVRRRVWLRGRACSGFNPHPRSHTSPQFAPSGCVGRAPSEDNHDTWQVSMPGYKHAQRPVNVSSYWLWCTRRGTGQSVIQSRAGRRRLDWPMARVWNTRWGDKPLERSNRSASAPARQATLATREAGWVVLSVSGRARWGVGGSLNSKSALRETEFPPAAPRACGKRLAAGAEGWVPREPAS
jgi:hypothetical protein